MSVELYDHQQEAVDKLKPGSILCGGVGSGKSRTSVAYYFLKECGCKIRINGDGETEAMKTPKDLYIITTAKKRDSLEWEHELAPFSLTTVDGQSLSGVNIIIDSWNNIKKYSHVKNAFFIFDEQRLVGAGTWVKAFIKISQSNNWILLTATPGDTWSDYIPVFLANKFYKNRTEFLRQHAVYSRYSKYPKVERYLETAKLKRLRDSITVVMPFVRPTISHDIDISVDFDKERMRRVKIDRWNIYKDRPIRAVSELYYTMRKVVNSDLSRVAKLLDIFNKHKKLIVFYNFDYELEILREFCIKNCISFGEWNGHKHESIPSKSEWIYLVQYTSGAEGWNCIETDTTVFYSQNYSYKIMVQAAGRTNRLNSPFRDLYFYHLKSNSFIDMAISKSLKQKKNFNIHHHLYTRRKHSL